MNSISHSIRFITLISTILTIIPISDTYSSPDSQTYDIKTDFTIVMIIPLIFNFLNLFGSLYICYRTYLLWKYDYDKFIPLSTRFPFYIAITDFLFSMIIVIDFSYSASNVTVLENKGVDGVVTWPSPYCEMLGLLNTSFILLNMTLVGAISVTTWLRVVRECYFNWGKYDYKIWFPIIFVSFIIPLISAREFGAQKYWCGIKNNDSSMISAFVLIMIILTLLTIMFCYTHMLKIIHEIKDDDTSITDSEIDSVQRTNIERKTLKKVLTYIFIFLFQYIPFLVSDICKLLKVQYIVLYALSPSAISMGGLSNLIQYLRNEGSSILFRSSSSNNNINLEENEHSNSI